MIRSSSTECPKCGGKLKYVGPVKRMIRTKGGHTYWIRIRRMMCVDCGTVHRELPDFLLPYKHYERRIIQGVQNGTITPYDIEYEDYPSEMTMKRWMNSRK